LTTGKGPSEISQAKARLQDLDRRIIACRHCPRLVEHREKIGRAKRASYAGWDYWAKPITGFGDLEAQVLILGLAPAAHGGNRTGRVFSGDSSANFLMKGLHQAGFANQPTSEHRDDGLELRNAYLSAAVRCVPPGDKPTTQEQQDCLPFLVEELDILPRLTTVLALGHIAFRACLRALSQRAGHTVTAKFGHGARHHLEDGLPEVVTCYHPSPRNTNTGRLTMDSFVEVLQSVQDNAGAKDTSRRLR
jgi:uracil-DNA glycosylase family 4